MPREKRSATELKATVALKKQQRKAAQLGKPVDTIVLPTKSILKPTTKVAGAKSAVLKPALKSAVVTAIAPVAKRHSKPPPKNAENSITWPVIIRFARIAGCKRIQKMHAIIRSYMLEETRMNLRGSIIFTQYRKKKTVSQSNVLEFASRNGGGLYTSSNY